jgi:hypothetical protein
MNSKPGTAKLDLLRDMYRGAGGCPLLSGTWIRVADRHRDPGFERDR